jgi:hypothetical protein
VLGSLSLALPSARIDDALTARIAPLTAAGARAVERIMSNGPDAAELSPARVKIVR